jgi:hypothetical protein
MTARETRTPRPYAEGTEVSEEQSQQQLEKLLRRYGATEYARGWRESHALVGFVIGGRQIRILLPLPEERQFWFDPSGRRRQGKKLTEAWEQEIRRRWRALLLVVKAKLEAVASEISTIEEAFLPWVVLPNGQTMGEWAAPQIARAYEQGHLPELLPGLPPAEERCEP